MVDPVSLALGSVENEDARRAIVDNELLHKPNHIIDSVIDLTHDSTAMKHNASIDVVIIGGGPVGLITLLSLMDDFSGSITLIDKNNWCEVVVDQRVIALSAGSMASLLQWSVDLPMATPIEHIDISVAQKAIHTQIDRSELAVPQLGSVVRYRDLISQLRAAITHRHTRMRDGGRINIIQGATAEVAGQTAELVHIVTPTHPMDNPLQCRLVIQTEGGLYDTPPATANGALWGSRSADFFYDYQQLALSAVVNCEQMRPNCAFERFLPTGPIALLPLQTRTHPPINPQEMSLEYGMVRPFGGAPLQHQYALVWCGPTTQMQGWHEQAHTNPAKILKALTEQFHHQFGAFTHITDVAIFPLGLRFRTQALDNRCVYVGNSAQNLHPVAGQGLNLGFRDALTFTDYLRHHPNALNHPSVLQVWAQSRRSDRQTTALLTHLLATGFAEKGNEQGLRDLWGGYDARAMPMWLRRQGARGMFGLLNHVPIVRQAFFRGFVFGWS